MADDISPNIPLFDDHLPDLNQFILELKQSYNARKLQSWDDLDEAVKDFFIPERMDQMEVLVPGWRKMASYSGGITLTHVMCVFLGVFLMPEFKALTHAQQQIAKWIVLFHDVDKFHLRGKKDTMHAFRSGVVAANTLPAFGFPVTGKYHTLIHTWSELTLQAFTMPDPDTAPKPDNQKLPEILASIEQLFGEDTPACLITKVVLLHLSLDADPFYPTPAPLTDDEVRRFINPTLLPLLKVMMLGDNEGWALFEPEDRMKQYDYTVAAFQRFERLIGK